MFKEESRSSNFSQRMEEPIAEITPEQARKAALQLASVASQRCTCPTGSDHSACGLAEVLDALSLKEILQEAASNLSPKKVV